MNADSLARALRSIAATAERLEADARRGEVSPVLAGAILEELTGATPGHAWRWRIGPEAAAASCLAKAVRVLASMQASARGLAPISIAGVLDDLAGGELEEAAAAGSRRACLGCGRSFASDGPGNRLCGECLAGEDGPDETDAMGLQPPLQRSERLEAHGVSPRPYSSPRES